MNYDSQMRHQTLFEVLNASTIISSCSNTSCVCLAVSDSLRPHGLQPIGLIIHGNSPGKNTGVGCHALLNNILPIKFLLSQRTTYQTTTFHRLILFQSEPLYKASFFQFAVYDLILLKSISKYRRFNCH